MKKILFTVLSAAVVMALNAATVDQPKPRVAGPVMNGRELTLSLGGYPNFLYFTSYDTQIANRLVPLFQRHGVRVTVEYHPWATVPKFINQFDHGTVAPVYGDGKALVKGYIYSTRFDIDVDRDLAVILKDTVENRLTLELINHALESTTK